MLDIAANDIGSIEIFDKLEMPKLEELKMGNNRIRDMKPARKWQWQLKELCVN